MTRLAGVTAVLSAMGCAQNRSPEQVGMDVDGARLWMVTCDRCHNARSALEFTPDQWPVIVSHMRTRAGLTKSEASAVSDYLRGLSARTEGGR